MQERGDLQIPSSVFYLRDMASESEGLFCLGPLSVSQQVVSGK